MLLSEAEVGAQLRREVAKGRRLKLWAKSWGLPSREVRMAPNFQSTGL